MKSTTLPNSLEVLSLFLPCGCLDYFDVTGYDNMDTCYVISLEEGSLLTVNIMAEDKSVVTVLTLRRK